ncbi:MAG: hypothetical protein OXQ31_26005 [Spirochaetaceae bacterium]|nr:hypothetical protein [Spirochaetaceae bacterium]
MAAVKVHLVGGFLGSGKTTAIRSACELLRQRGEAASVITNDQGTLLIDTAFLRGSHPTREVTGGCFCCRYDQLVELLAYARRDGAQHVFAEAVGSCADLVATVVRPLLGSASGPVDRVSFTAMVDARVLIRLQSGEPLPWSGDIAYLFLEQLREAPLLVASKWDLVTDPPSLATSGNGSGIPGPGQTLLCQDGRTPAGVAGWVDALCDPEHPATAAAGACDLGIDYARYSAGEEALAWLDAEVRVDAAEGGARAAAGRLVRAVVTEVSADAEAVGHVKFLIRDHLYDVKVSHTAGDEAPEQALLGELGQLERLSDRRLYVVVNARAEIGAERLQRILEGAVAASAGGATLAIIRSAAFHPEPPQPARMAAL